MKVKLKNVGIVEDCEVEFSPGITILAGTSCTGKSTLLRSIHSMATNEFSDSNISFGKNTMNISIEYNGNTVEYTRHIKSKGDKFYYTVNGEKYVKVGRQALSAVTDALKLGDIDINGEDINFNFNLQFSSPFLIFGSQSTLYNVLTYRSQFDIAQINDLYSVDVRNNANELTSNNKLKENLTNTLYDLRSQESKLSPIENLYSDFVKYKHKLEILEDIKSLHNKINLSVDIQNKLNIVNDLVCSTSSSIAKVSKLKEFTSYKETFVQKDVISNTIKKHTAIINKLAHAISTCETLSSISHIKELTNKYKSISKKTDAIDFIIERISAICNKEHLVCDMLTYKDLLYKYDKYNSIVDVLDKSKDDKSNVIEAAINMLSKFKELHLTCDKISIINTDIEKVNAEIDKFEICPLCGEMLHNHKHQ
jgi:hypothetical protein